MTWINPLKIYEKYANMICNRVGYLPLAIVLIGSYLRMYSSDLTFEEYYKELENNRLGAIDLDQISDKELATRHVSAVRVTFEEDWKILKRQEGENIDLKQKQKIQNAQKILSLQALFPESAIVPKNRLIIYSAIDKFSKSKLIRPFEFALNLLDEMNLIDLIEDRKAVRIHPLIREFILEKLDNEIIKKIKLDSLLNLKKKYYDKFLDLVEEYNERDGDIDSILIDLEIGTSWSKDININHDPILNIKKILEKESRNLRLKDKDSFISSISSKIDKQLVFSQQVHIRATDLQQNEIVQRSREYMMMLQQSKNRSFFDILWASVKDKSTLIRTLEGHSSSVRSVAITPDSTKIVSGSYDNTIKVWDLASGRLLNTLEGHSSSVRSVAITPDSTKIVSGSRDKTIKVWDLNNGSNTFSCKFDSSISSIAISTKRNILVFGDSTGDLYVMNV